MPRNFTSDIDDGDDELQHLPRFYSLAQKAESVIRRFERHQLQSFSWDLGTCLPPEILGVLGVIPIQQSSLQSLSLITDPTCRASYDGECEIDLSPFSSLQSLSWRGPTSDNLHALTVALRNNSTHLRNLELDFLNWHELREYLGYYGDDEDDLDGTKEINYFADVVLGLNRHSPRPLFPRIRVLSLSQVPLSTAMAHAFNFETLSSLMLRMCPNCHQFLKRVMQLNHPIKLKRLEIQEWSETFVLDYLNAFEGLEELFVGEAGPTSALELWGHVAHRHPNLKRFVGHQRMINTNEDSPHFERACDVPDLGISGHSMHRIKEDPSQNPLAKLDLEFIGIPCMPKRLKYILFPFTSKTSLKVLHIRQSAPNIEQGASWAINEDPALATSITRSDTSSESGESLSWTDSGPTTPTGAAGDVTFGPNAVEVTAYNHGGSLWPLLQHDFRQFLEWAFGPQGIASLDIVAFGDFAHGGRENEIVKKSKISIVTLWRPVRQNRSLNFEIVVLSEHPTRVAELDEGRSQRIEACLISAPHGGLFWTQKGDGISFFEQLPHSSRGLVGCKYKPNDPDLSALSKACHELPGTTTRNHLHAPLLLAAEIGAREYMIRNPEFRTLNGLACQDVPAPLYFLLSFDRQVSHQLKKAAHHHILSRCS
ncbi:AAA family ATPase [Fusarium tjaetaba]|uniref:AAA family ATPase n=1 Tax=Fusarium tjaetaba TaxID=1567544 RepID=A0A8H5VTR5_9HYPO|nr:AAA family ATPase [Fusarium tjaetaba]KAF5635326.1 AAA family ATPase [Fusarium tjaetaba]